MAYAVVNFLQDPEVRKSWLNASESTWWPNRENPTSLMSRGILPDEAWDKYLVEVECICCK